MPKFEKDQGFAWNVTELMLRFVGRCPLYSITYNSKRKETT